MFKYLKEYRFYIILFLFVLIPVIAIDTSTRHPRNYRFYDRVIVSLTAPVQIIVSWTLESMIMLFQNYVYLWDTKHQNAELIEENRKLLNTIINLQEIEQENFRLRELLKFKEQFGLDIVVSRVIAKDVTTEFRTIRINRGENSGIKVDMPVINHEGVVGRVLRTTSDTADVVTILDLLSGIDVIDKRSRSRGIIEGLTDDICQLKYALRTDDIQPGDLFITSGIEGIFPKGIPAGYVSEVHRKSHGISQNVKIVPSVNFSKLEEVMVITNSETSPIHTAREDRLFISSSEVTSKISSTLEQPEKKKVENPPKDENKPKSLEAS